MAGFYERYWVGKRGSPLSDLQRKWPVLAPLVPDPDDRNLTILDYRCGDGQILMDLKKINPVANFIVADVSETALRVARHHLPHVTFLHLQDGGRVAINDGVVDFIFSSEVIEHVYDTEATFQ